jgi:hypothetical protein
MKTSTQIVRNIVALSLTLLAFRATAYAVPFPELSLVFPTSTLVGYSGGSLCSGSLLCVQGSPLPNLVSGLLLPPTGVMGPFALSASFTPVSPAGTFDLSGTLTDGAALGGTMTLNEAAGVVTAASFTIGAPDSITASLIVFDGSITCGICEVNGSPNGPTFRLVETAVPTPEPGTAVLMVTTLGVMVIALGLVRRTRRHRAALN